MGRTEFLTCKTDYEHPPWGWQGRTFNESETNRSLESADGSMATAATRREKNLVQRKNNGTCMTPTGLLMEGDFTNCEKRQGAKKRMSDGQAKAEHRIGRIMLPPREFA
jgi:hypothetical protein